MSEVLAEKTTTIGGAKDLAMDLQKRANDLAGLASNKLSFLSGKFCLQLEWIRWPAQHMFSRKTNSEFWMFTKFLTNQTMDFLK